jgi:hypothetical protein
MKRGRFDGRPLNWYDHNTDNPPWIKALAKVRRLAPPTVSNIERGRNATPESIKSIRKALRQAGVNISFGNDMAMVGIAFVDRNVEDDD